MGFNNDWRHAKSADSVAKAEIATAHQSERRLALEALALMQATRPLGRPGSKGWRLPTWVDAKGEYR